MNFDNFLLNTDLSYPPILRHGSTAFSKGAGPETVAVASGVDISGKTYLVWEESSIGVFIHSMQSIYLNATSKVYISGGILYIALYDSGTRSGDIHWREYGLQ